MAGGIALPTDGHAIADDQQVVLEREAEEAAVPADLAAEFQDFQNENAK